MSLKLGYENASKKTMLKDSYHQVVLIQMVEASIRISKNSSQVSKRTLFPHTLARTCTVHNVQGITLTTTVVSLELVKQRTF